MISRISGAAYLTETHGSSIRLIRIRDYASDHVELHSFVCTPGHATRSDAYPTRQRGHGVRFSSMFEPSGKRARDERCAVGPSFTAVGPSFTAVGPSFTAVGPSFTAGRVPPCAWRHWQHSGSQVAAHAPTRSVSAPPAPVGKAWRRGEHLHASDHV